MIYGSNATGSSSSFRNMQDSLTKSVPLRCDNQGDMESGEVPPRGEKVVFIPTTKLVFYVVTAAVFLIIALLAYTTQTMESESDRRRMCCNPFCCGKRNKKLTCARWANWGLPFVFLMLIIWIFMEVVYSSVPREANPGENSDGSITGAIGDTIADATEPFKKGWASLCTTIRDGDNNLQSTVMSVGTLMGLLSVVSIFIIILGTITAVAMCGCAVCASDEGPSDGCNCAWLVMDCSGDDDSGVYQGKKDKAKRATCLTTFKTLVSAVTVVPAALMLYGLQWGDDDVAQEGKIPDEFFEHVPGMSDAEHPYLEDDADGVLTIADLAEESGRSQNLLWLSVFIASIGIIWMLWTFVMWAFYGEKKKCCCCCKCGHDQQNMTLFQTSGNSAYAKYCGY